MKSLKKIFILSLFLMTSIFGISAQNQVLQIFRNDRIVSQYDLSDIDYIEVNNTVDSPENVIASISNENILIQWDEITDATYDVLRSRDNMSYHIIGRNITETEFLDSAPLHGANYYKVIAKIGGTASNPSLPTQPVMYKENEIIPSGLYLGITAFNNQLTTKPVGILNPDTKGAYELFVQNLTTKDGTILYHAVDNTIDLLQSTPFPEDLSTVAIVTFTDGLDMGSLMMSTDYLTKREYLDALTNRIAQENVSGISIDSYSIGIRGNDISDIAEFNANLKGLASRPENAWEVSSMDAVNERFQAIAEKLVQKSYRQKISLKIPGPEHGARIRFTFDDVTDAAKSQLYIEGTFDLRSRSLTDVVYLGMTAGNGATVEGETSGIFVNFNFFDVSTDNGDTIDSAKAKEWTYTTSSSKWQINSEFTPDDNTETVVTKTSAAIILVLDCSKSLGSDFTQLQSKAISFIDKLAAGTQLPESTIEGDLYESFHNALWDVAFKGVKAGQTLSQAQDVSMEFRSTVDNSRIDGLRVVKFTPTDPYQSTEFYMLYNFDIETNKHTFKWKLGEKCCTWTVNRVVHDIVPCIVNVSSGGASAVARFTHNVVSTYDTVARTFSTSFKPDWMMFVWKDNTSMTWTTWYTAVNDFVFKRK